MISLIIVESNWCRSSCPPSRPERRYLDGEPKKIYLISLSTTMCSRDFDSLLARLLVLFASRLPFGIARIKQSIYMCFRLSYFHSIRAEPRAPRQVYRSTYIHLVSFISIFLLHLLVPEILCGLWKKSTTRSRSKSNAKAKYETITKASRNDRVDLKFLEASQESFRVQRDLVPAISATQWARHNRSERHATGGEGC